MEFVNEGRAIHCIRNQFDTNVEIVSFDEGLTAIPPHVEAKLFPEEAVDLEQWLRERRQLKAQLENNSLGETLLQTIPDLINKATSEAKKMDEIDDSLYSGIKKSLLGFSDAIEGMKRVDSQPELQQNILQQPEVTKEQMKEISDNL